MSRRESGWTRRSLASALGGAVFARGAEPPRPNILWITTEDIRPQIGAEADVTRSLSALVDLASVTKPGAYVPILALKALDQLELEKIRRVRADIEALPLAAPSAPVHVGSEYVGRLKERFKNKLA